MIPVFEPVFGEEEIARVVDAMQRGEISGTFGTYLKDFERRFAEYCGVRHGIAVTSGTTALQLAVAAAGIGPGDEVLISASTNIATALSVVHNNAIPIPVDSEKETWNLDLNKVEGLVTPKTRAIIPVHLFGHPVDMDCLVEIAKRHNLTIIEDCAESHGATCRGKKTGSFGDMGCFSFYANKVITTGEGGMVVTDDDGLAERMRLLRNLGFTRPRFRHEVLGFNFRMTGIQAAMGLAQLEKIDRIIAEKRRVAKAYNHFLSGIPGIRLPVEKEWAVNVYWMYGMVVGPEFGMGRDELRTALQEKGIDTRTFFCPMSQQPCLLSRAEFPKISCPVADSLWENGLYLPSTYTLSEDVIQGIASIIRELGVGIS